MDSAGRLQLCLLHPGLHSLFKYSNIVEKIDKISIDGAEIELHVDASLVPSVLRTFAGSTPMDLEIDSQPIPEKPRWLNLCIRFLRWYRRLRPAHIGQRCVFDPSCSRYSELAFLRHGFFKGCLATIKRLQRCKPGSGGVDVP